MKVVIDNKIPYIKESIEKLVDNPVFLPGNQFTPEAVRDADALVVRTRTRCNRELLEGSNVRFIATATIGFDHIDTDYCREAGISWTNAPGCNAGSVAQYLHSCILLLKRQKEFVPEHACIGIVGVGNVGKRVKQVAESLGMRVLLNDPPRQKAEGPEGFVDLDTIARECDVITFHTPLIYEGEFSTFHLAGETFFRSLVRKPVIINTSRGEVVETGAVYNALQKGMIRDVILDVWEHEPDIDTGLLQKAFIATPHIAGYSADGKANATRMSLEALCDFFHLEKNFTVFPPKPEQSVLEVSCEDEAYLLMYDPQRDSEALKLHPEQFEWFRGNYPLRREMAAYRVHIIDRSL